MHRCGCAWKPEESPFPLYIEISPGISWRAERMQPLLLCSIHEDTTGIFSCDQAAI